MKVLVACEESQRVCIAFREKGHLAYSCDIIDQSGGHPEWHIRQDVISLLNGNCEFITTDGKTHKVIGEWDMIIAFPPYTYLTNAGNRHFSLKLNTEEDVNNRWVKRIQAVNFFMEFVNAKCDKIVIENPVGYMSTAYRKPDQIIHPYYFAMNENDVDNYVQKRTCLRLKGVGKLKVINNLPKPGYMYTLKGDKCKGKKIGWCEGIRGIKGGQEERAKARSKTFPGIAKAMADQWGGGETHD